MRVARHYSQVSARGAQSQWWRSMRLPHLQRRAESWEEMRQRLIEETSAYITEFLRHPELATRIPVIEAGKGRFPPSLTPAFWDRVLND